MLTKPRSTRHRLDAVFSSVYETQFRNATNFEYDMPRLIRDNFSHQPDNRKLAMTDVTTSPSQPFDLLVRTRRSVRGFLDKRVPDEVLDDVFETARWAPSGTNVQPWHICVASGDVCEEIRQGFLERAANKVAVKIDHPSDQRLGDPWRARKRGCAKVLYDSMDVDWDDKEGRGRVAARNYEFFDAPHVAFLCMHEGFGMQSAADVGMYAQTLMLALTTHGVASCAQGTLRNYPDLVREKFGLEPEIKVLFGISFGYEDTNVPANAARTQRAPLTETVQFMG